MLVLGIDSGTQSTKAIVLDLASGRVVGEGRAPHHLIEGLPPGHLEQHPATWVAALETAVAAALADVDRGAVRALGVSGQQHGFVPLDAAHTVIRPAKLWCDTSTTEECRLLTEALGGPDATVAALGNAFLPGYTAPKVLWLRRHEPAHFARLRHILLPHDYLNLHLTGATCADHGDASGTALYDVRHRAWSAPACAAIGPEVLGCLPALRAATEPAGTLRADVAARLGLSPRVLVSAGSGDNMMGALGTGNVRPGVVTASLGTSGTIYACSSTPVVDPAGEIAAFCDATGAFLPLLCTMNVTTATEQMRALFGADHAAVDAAVATVPPGSNGLLLLPYLEGERTPSVPDGSGVLLGLNRTTMHPAHLLRATMEGVALGLNYGLGRMRALGIRPSEIRLTGGGARSGAWRRILADVFGVPVVPVRGEEGAALGAALQAAWCALAAEGNVTGIAALTDRLVALDEPARCVPEPAAVARYAALQAVHDALGQALRPVFTRHHAVKS